MPEKADQQIAHKTVKDMPIREPFPASVLRGAALFERATHICADLIV